MTVELHTHYVFAHGLQCTYNNTIQWVALPPNVIVIMNCDPVTTSVYINHFSILYNENFDIIKKMYNNVENFKLYMINISSLFNENINSCVYFKEFPNIDLYFDETASILDMMNGVYELPIKTNSIIKDPMLDMKNPNVAREVQSPHYIVKTTNSQIQKKLSDITNFLSKQDGFHVVVTTACRSLRDIDQNLEKYPVIGEDKLYIYKGKQFDDLKLIHQSFLTKINAYESLLHKQNMTLQGGKGKIARKKKKLYK